MKFLNRTMKLDCEIWEEYFSLHKTLHINLPDNIGVVMLYKNWKYLAINCEELIKEYAK